MIRNKRYTVACAYLLTLLMAAPPCRGQSLSDKALLKHILSQVSSYNVIGYRFKANISFPDGTEQQVNGEGYVNKPEKILYNSDDYSVTICNKDWMYKVDHSERTVSIISLDKSMGPLARKQMNERVFGEYASNILDSSLVAKGVIKKLSIRGDSVIISLGFPETLMIKSFELIYDQKNKIPLYYAQSIFYPAPDMFGNEGKKGTLKKVSCFGFTRAYDKNKYTLSNYYNIERGKVILKKYNKYHLNTKL